MGLLKKVIILIVVLMFVSALLIIRDENLNLTKKDDVAQFGRSYVVWAGNVVKNVVGITSYAIKRDWLPRS